MICYLYKISKNYTAENACKIVCPFDIKFVIHLFSLGRLFTKSNFPNHETWNVKYWNLYAKITKLRRGPFCSINCYYMSPKFEFFGLYIQRNVLLTYINHQFDFDRLGDLSQTLYITIVIMYVTINLWKQQGPR